MTSSILKGRLILLIVSGGIAAYKSLELIRRIRERGAAVRCILTAGGARFVTPLSLAAVSEDRVYEDLFSLTDESEMGHIRLSREADLIVVAPASAGILAKMAAGLADDLGTTALLATDKPVMIAPAMNVRMWGHPATRANLTTLAGRGVLRVGPVEGAMACNEWGMGRMAEPEDILGAIESFFAEGQRLVRVRALVTSGPTLEAIDPVRFIANRSSGKQGHAIATALAGRGAETTLITGPTSLSDPPGTTVVCVESALDMLDSTLDALPVDVAICAAAVSDWRVETPAPRKMKKTGDRKAPMLTLAENPDILATLSALDGTDGGGRPRLVIGFAAETEDVVENAGRKRVEKGCDWILANDVSPETGTFAGDANTVHLITGSGVEDWPTLSKTAVAERLAERIARHLEEEPRPLPEERR